MSSAAPTAVPEKFKPTHPFVIVVPSRDLKPSLNESLVLLKVLIALQLKGMECDFVSLSECTRIDSVPHVFYTNYFFR